MIGDAPMVESFSYFITPIMLSYTFGFLVAFEFATNFYAELSGFADRQFY